MCTKKGEGTEQLGLKLPWRFQQKEHSFRDFKIIKRLSLQLAESILKSTGEKLHMPTVSLTQTNSWTLFRWWH